MNQANLVKRLVFAAWAIPAGWFAVNSDFSLLPHALTEKIFTPLHPFLFPGHLVAVVVVLLACSEYIAMLRHSFPRNGFWLVYLWLGYQFASYFIPTIALRNQLDTYILLIIVAAEAAIWGRHTERWKRASLLFSGTVFLDIAGYSLLNFYYGSLQTVFPHRFDGAMLSQMGIVTILAAVFLCDTSAYFIGSLFGKHHFSSVSPNKTIEGAVAGFVAAVIISMLGWHFFADTVRYPLWMGLGMGMLIGVFAQLGDLLVSLIKRYFQVKDASNIIPGHGGILDRFDSVFFTAPTVTLFMMLLTRMAE